VNASIAVVSANPPLPDAATPRAPNAAPRLQAQQIILA
jgi:hypothetical protein